MNQFRASLRTPPANMAAHPTPAAPGAKRPVPAGTTRSRTVPPSQDTMRPPMPASTTPTTAPNSPSQGSVVRKRTAPRPEDAATPRKEESLKSQTSVSSTKAAPPLVRKTTPVRASTDGGGTIRVTRPTTPLPLGGSKLPDAKIPSSTATTPRASRLPLRATASKTSTGSRTSTGTIDSPPRTVRVMTMKPVPMKAKMNKTPPPSPTPMSGTITPPPTLSPRPPTVIIKPKVRVAASSSTSTQSARSSTKDSSTLSVPASLISGTLVPPGTIAKKRSSGLREPVTKGGKSFESEEQDGLCSRESCAAIATKPRHDMKYAKSPTPESKESIMSAPPIGNRTTLGKTSSKTIILELELPNKATSIATVGSKKGSNAILSKVATTVSSPTASPMASPTNIKDAVNGGSSSSLLAKKRLPNTVSEGVTDQKKSSLSDHDSSTVVARKESQSEEIMGKAKNQAQVIHHLSEKLRTHPPKSAPTSKERGMVDRPILTDKLMEHATKTQRASLSQDQLMLKQQQQLKLQQQQQLYHEAQSMAKPIKHQVISEKRPTKRSTSRIAIDQKSKASAGLVKEENYPRHAKRSSLSLVDDPGLKIQSKQSSITINDENKHKVAVKKVPAPSAPAKVTTKVAPKSTSIAKKGVVKDKVKGDSVNETKSKTDKDADEKLEKDNVRSFVLMVDEPILKHKLKHLAKEEDIGDKKSTYENKKSDGERREEILQQKLNFILKEQTKAIEEDSPVDEETLSEVDQSIIASLETFGEEAERLSIDTQTVEVNDISLTSTLQSAVQLDRLVALSSGSQMNYDSEVDVSRVPSIPVSVATQVSYVDGSAKKIDSTQPIDNERQSLLSYGSQQQDDGAEKTPKVGAANEISDLSIEVKSLIESIETERQSLSSYDSECLDELSSIGKMSILFADHHKALESVTAEGESFDPAINLKDKDHRSDFPMGDKESGVPVNEDDVNSDDVTNLFQTTSESNAPKENENDPSKFKDAGKEVATDNKEVGAAQRPDAHAIPSKRFFAKVSTIAVDSPKSDTSKAAMHVDSMISAKSMPPSTAEDISPSNKTSTKSLQAKKSVLSARLVSPTTQLGASASSIRHSAPNFEKNPSQTATPVTSQLKMSTSSTRALSPDGILEKSSLPPVTEVEPAPSPFRNAQERNKSPRALSPTPNKINTSRSSLRSVSPTLSMHGRLSPRSPSPTSAARSDSPAEGKTLTVRVTSPSLLKKGSASAMGPDRQISARITSQTLMVKNQTSLSSQVSRSVSPTLTKKATLMTTKDIGTSPSPTMLRGFFKDSKSALENATLATATPDVENDKSPQIQDDSSPANKKVANISVCPLPDKVFKLARMSQSTTDIESLSSEQSYLEKLPVPSDPKFVVVGNTSDSSFADDQTSPLLLSAIAKDTISSPLIRRGRSEQPLDQGDSSDACLGSLAATSGTTVLSFVRQNYDIEKELSAGPDKSIPRLPSEAKLGLDFMDDQSANSNIQDSSNLLRKKSISDDNWEDEDVIPELPFQKQEVLALLGDEEDVVDKLSPTGSAKEDERAPSGLADEAKSPEGSVSPVGKEDELSTRAKKIPFPIRDPQIMCLETGGTWIPPGVFDDKFVTSYFEMAQYEKYMAEKKLIDTRDAQSLAIQLSLLQDSESRCSDTEFMSHKNRLSPDNTRINISDKGVRDSEADHLSLLSPDSEVVMSILMPSTSFIKNKEANACKTNQPFVDPLADIRRTPKEDFPGVEFTMESLSILSSMVPPNWPGHMSIPSTESQVPIRRENVPCEEPSVRPKVAQSPLLPSQSISNAIAPKNTVQQGDVQPIPAKFSISVGSEWSLQSGMSITDYRANEKLIPNSEASLAAVIQTILSPACSLPTKDHDETNIRQPFVQIASSVCSTLASGSTSSTATGTSGESKKPPVSKAFDEMASLSEGTLSDVSTITKLSICSLSFAEKPSEETMTANLQKGSSYICGLSDGSSDHSVRDTLPNKTSLQVPISVQQLGDTSIGLSNDTITSKLTFESFSAVRTDEQATTGTQPTIVPFLDMKTQDLSLISGDKASLAFQPVELPEATHNLESQESQEFIERRAKDPIELHDDSKNVHSENVLDDYTSVVYSPSTPSGVTRSAAASRESSPATTRPSEDLHFIAAARLPSPPLRPFANICYNDNFVPAARVVSPPTVRPSEGTHSLLPSGVTASPTPMQIFGISSPPETEITDLFVASGSPNAATIKSEDSRIASPPTRPYEDNVSEFRILSPPLVRPAEDTTFTALSRVYSPPTRGPSEDATEYLTSKQTDEEMLKLSLQKALAGQAPHWSSANVSASLLRTIFRPGEDPACTFDTWIPVVPMASPSEEAINEALLRLPSPPTTTPTEDLTQDKLLRVVSPTVRTSEEMTLDKHLKIPALQTSVHSADTLLDDELSVPVELSGLTPSSTKLSEDTAFFKVSRLPSPVSESTCVFGSMLTIRMSDEPMSKLSRKPSPVAKPLEDTASPSSLIAKQPEHYPSTQYKAESGLSQGSSIQMGVDAANKRQQAGSFAFSKPADEVTDVNLQSIPSPLSCRQSEDWSTKRPSRRLSPVVVRLGEMNLHSVQPPEPLTTKLGARISMGGLPAMLPTGNQKDTCTSTSNLPQWPVVIENSSIAEPGALPQQYFSNSKMVPSIISEILPNKLEVEAFGSGSQIMRSKQSPVTTLQEGTITIPRRDEILKTFAIALSIGKLTPELQAVLSAISKCAACEKESIREHSDFPYMVPSVSSHDMLPPQKLKSMQQQQQEVLSKLSMALDSGKLSKELHSSLSELCVGEKTMIEQEAIIALSGLLSTPSLFSTCSCSSAMTARSVENSNTIATFQISTGSIEFEAREMKSIAAFGDSDETTDGSRPKTNSPVEVLSSGVNHPIIKCPSIGLQMPTPNMSQFSTDASFLDEFMVSAESNTSGAMSIENEKATVGKPPKASTTSMREDASTRRKQKVKPSSLSLGEQPLQIHSKPNSWSVGEILFRQQTSGEDNQNELKKAKVPRDGSGLTLNKAFFKEDTSSEEIMAMYGGGSPKSVTLEPKGSSGDERPASNVTLGKLGDETVTPTESSYSSSIRTDTATPFGEILNDASFLSQLVTSLEKQQKKENASVNLINEDSESSTMDPLTDSSFNKTSNLMAAIDSVTLNPFQRWRTSGKHTRNEADSTSMDSDLLSQKTEKSANNRDNVSDNEMSEDVTSWSRVAAEAVDSLAASNSAWCSRFLKSNNENQLTESGFHDGAMIYPIENRQETHDAPANQRPAFILNENEWKGDNLNQDSFAPLYFNLTEPSQTQFPTPFVQQQYIGENMAMVPGSQAEMVISGQQFSNEQYDNSITEQPQFVIGIPYTHSYANERGRHNENQSQMLGPPGQHFLSESKIVYTPHLGCSMSFQRPNATTVPVHTSLQSTPAVRSLDRKTPQSTPAVTKLRADAIPFVQSNKTSSALATPVFASQYHQGLSSEQTQFSNPANAAYMHQNSGQKITSLLGQVQYQQGFNHGMFLSGRMDQLSYPYERTYLPDQITYDGMNNMNWQFQLNGNRKLNVSDSNEMIPEPVADVPKPDPCSHWSSGETRSQSYDTGQSDDHKNQASNATQITPLSSCAEIGLSDSRDNSEIDASLPVEHFFSLVDVTLTPSFIPSRVASRLTEETGPNEVANRPATPGPYVSQNESLDSQLDATEIPPPRNEHLFPQLKEAGGIAVSSALTLGKEFTGVGVGSLLKDQRMIQQQEKDMQFNTPKISIVVSNSSEPDENKLLSSFNVDIVSVPEDVPWSSLVSSEEYTRGAKMSASEQQFMDNIKDWSEMDEIERISAEEFYPRQEMMSQDNLRSMGNWSDKLTRISAEDFFQQRLLRQKIDDIQMDGESVEGMREDSRMSAEDFFQMCNLKQGQWQTRPDSNLPERSHLSDRRFTHLNRFSQLNDQWPPAQFVQNVNSSYVPNHYQEHFYEKNLAERQPFFSKEQNHLMHGYHGGEHFYPKTESSSIEDENSYINSISLSSQSTGHMNQFCADYYIHQDHGQYYNMHGHNFLHKPEQYSISSPQMTLTHSTAHNLGPDKQGKPFQRGISGICVELDSEKQRSSASSVQTSTKFAKIGSNQHMFGPINEMSNFGASVDQAESKSSGECFRSGMSDLNLEEGALPSLDLLTKSNRLLDVETKKLKSSSLESRLSVIPEETRQSAEDFYKAKEARWRCEKAQAFNMGAAAVFVAPQKSELFVPITNEFANEIPSIGQSAPPVEATESETQTQCVLIVSVPEELIPDGDFEVSKRLIEDRLARLLEVELATLMAPPRPDSLMVVAESSVVELLNRYRELNSQQSLLEISKSACQSPNTSLTGMSEPGNDEEAIITVVAAANLQHSAAYRLEKFLESLTQPPVESVVNVYNTLEGTPSTEFYEYEVVNSTLEGCDVASTPAEMLICKRATDDGLQTGDMSNSAAVEVAEETSSSQEYLEDIMEESGEYSSLEVSTNEQEALDDDVLRREEMEFEQDEDFKTRGEIGHGDVTNDEEEDDDDDDQSLIAVYKGRTSPSLIDSSLTGESASDSASKTEVASEVTATTADTTSATMVSELTVPGKPAEPEVPDRPSEQQLVVSPTDQYPFDRWTNTQSNHVTGFCLVEQPALLSRERISTTIRKRLSEHDLKTTDAKNLMSLLAAPMDWPDESPIPKPRRSPKESSGDNRQIPVPSPRKLKLDDGYINMAKNVQIGKIANLQQSVKKGQNGQIENARNSNKEKPRQVYRAKAPVLYLRLPKSLVSELPPLPPSPPTSSSNSTPPNTPSSMSPNTLSRSPNTTPRSLNVSPNASPNTSPRSSIASPKIPNKSPLVTPQIPIPSPRLLSPILTTDSLPVASPRIATKQHAIGDEVTKCRNTNDRSPSPLPRRRHTSPMLRNSRSPSPMARLRPAMNEHENEMVSPPLASRSRSTTPELEKCYLNGNWSPIPLPRHSPKQNDAKTASPTASQPNIVLDGIKTTLTDETITQIITDLQRKPSLTSVEPSKDEVVQKRDEEDEDGSEDGSEEEMEISMPEPQESSPFLVAVVASPPPSPPITTPPLISTLETIPEVGSQTELPMKRTPVKKAGPLKLTKEHLLSPKFLLELLTPPSMLHAKPPLCSDSRTKQWRVPSPLPLSWLLPQSLPYRQLGIPHMNHLSSLPLTNLEPTVMQSANSHSQPQPEEWLPPRLTLPSLQKPLATTLPLVSEATSSDDALSFWHPPSPTPLPEGAVTPAPLAMEVRVGKVTEERKVEFSTTELRLPSPLPVPMAAKLDASLRTSPSFHHQTPSPGQARRGCDHLDDTTQLHAGRCTPSPRHTMQFTAEVEEVPLKELAHDVCEQPLRPGWSPRHQVHASYSRVNRNTTQRSVSPRTPLYQRPVSPARCQHSTCSAAPSSYHPLMRPHSPMYHQSRYPPSPNRIIDQWFPAAECQAQQYQPQQYQAQQYPSPSYSYPVHQEQYSQETTHYTVDDLPPIPPVTVAKRVQSPYSLRTPSPRPVSPRQPAPRHYSPPRHVQKPASPPRPVHRSPTRSMWPTSRDVINASPHDGTPPSMTSPLQLHGVNKLYTLVIEDESGAESDESEDAVQTLEEEEVIDHRVINHRLIDHQVIISEPGLSEEEDADAIANALHPEDGYPTYSMYQHYQRAPAKKVSPTYHQPTAPFHFQASGGMADRVSPSRNCYDMNWIPESVALANPYVRMETVNSDSDDDLLEGHEDDLAMEVPYYYYHPPYRVLNTVCGLYPFARF